jgi:hypothetical protein
MTAARSRGSVDGMWIFVVTALLAALVVLLVVRRNANR